MKKIFIVCVLCLVLCGCKNVYRNAIKDNLEGWKYWQENYYIQKITTYETLSPYYIQDIPYVSVCVNINSKYDPYNNASFKFFVRKDYPSSMGIPFNKSWHDWVFIVKHELRKEIGSNP